MQLPYRVIGYDILVVLEWGASIYFCFAEGKSCSQHLSVRTDFSSTAILIWRLYALCNQSKLLLYVLVGSFLPIVAVLIGTDIYLYSRPHAFSGEFSLRSDRLQADSILLHSQRIGDSEHQVLHLFLQHWAYACDLYVHPHCVL
jgi:hypothetical protein